MGEEKLSPSPISFGHFNKMQKLGNNANNLGIIKLIKLMRYFAHTEDWSCVGSTV